MTSYSLFVSSRGGFPLRPNSNGQVLMPVKMPSQGLTLLVYFNNNNSNNNKHNLLAIWFGWITQSTVYINLYIIYIL